MDDKQGLWLYSVIENKGALAVDIMGIHGSSPVCIVEGDLYSAIVSREPLKKYPLERNVLLTHQKINEYIMAKQPVLPVRFATLASDEDQIKRDVLSNEMRIKEFKDAFDLTHNKNEFGLRARWKDLDPVFKEISTNNEKVKKAKEKSLEERGEKKHLSLIEVGHIVQAALEEKKTELTHEFEEELKPATFQYKHHKVWGDVNIFNSSFLVEGAKQPIFDSTINELVGRYEDRIFFKYVGPIPPYNFVEIVIHFNEEVGR